MSQELLLTLVRGLDLAPEADVLDLCCAEGTASLLLAHQLPVHCVGVDARADFLAVARQCARDLGLEERVQFRQMDPRHLELQTAHYDLILALGGALSSLGRVPALERLRFHLKPGGVLLLSEPVYLDSAPDLEVLDALERGRDEEGRPYELESNAPSPLVRAVFEHGPYGYETENGLRSLLEALDFEVGWSCLMPESVWSAHFAQARAHLGDDAGEWSELAREAIAFYALGGRRALGSLLLAARRPRMSDGGPEENSE